MVIRLVKPDRVTVSGSAAVASFQYGDNPQLTAKSAAVQANFSVDLSTFKVGGSVHISADNLSIKRGTTTLASVTNFEATATASGKLFASADTINVLSGKAVANGVSFTIAPSRVCAGIYIVLREAFLAAAAAFISASCCFAVTSPDCARNAPRR